MGFDLRGTGGEFRWNIHRWYALLRLAKQYGWKPEGTSHDDPDWNGTYTANNYQVVCASDAANLADAIERALPDIPNYPADKQPQDFNDFEWFAGDKEYLREFIAYCRAGEFALG